ncbi:YqzK family protein [Lentibacillus sp. N15]|uniref:YqzK family protein n=1 Tax=Lentibacillus songyuanensis TaxID=3136161 RepID=UPI0031BAF96C
MKQMIWDTLKIFIIFIGCTFLFYFGLRVMHTEYEQIHRYDAPDGPAVKVYQTDDGFIDRLNLFFRLGE